MTTHVLPAGGEGKVPSRTRGRKAFQAGWAGYVRAHVGLLWLPENPKHCRRPALLRPREALPVGSAEMLGRPCGKTLLRPQHVG